MSGNQKPRRPTLESIKLKTLANFSLAENGDANAQLEVGCCYAKGNGVEKNASEAVKWFCKAAEQGNAVAQYNLGVCYANGQGVEKNVTEAVKSYRKAAEQGFASAQCVLGIRYAHGEGTDQNPTEAAKWLHKAAKQRNAMGQYNLGVCYANGQGVEKNVTEAVKWYRKGAEQGHAQAQYNLGLCYDDGQGVEKNETEAVKWYRMAAEQGHVSAQYNLGLCYANGQGVDQDTTEAIKWYRKAAEQGDVDAQSILEIQLAPAQGQSENAHVAQNGGSSPQDEGNPIVSTSVGGIQVSNLNVIRWMSSEIVGTVFNLPSDVVVIGEGPFSQDVLINFLHESDCTAWDRDCEWIVVGRKGWDRGKLMDLIDDAGPSQLRVVSQELLFAAMSSGHDPFSADLDVLLAFAKGHPALEYLMSSPFEWPESDWNTDFSGESIINLPWGEDESPLARMEYHVGKVNGLTPVRRRLILRQVFEGNLPWVGSNEYMAQWGRSNSRRRLWRMANHLKWLLRNRRTNPVMVHAVKDWKSDFLWLKKEFYTNRMRFSWPNL